MVEYIDGTEAVFTDNTHVVRLTRRANRRSWRSIRRGTAHLAPLRSHSVNMRTRATFLVLLFATLANSELSVRRCCAPGTLMSLDFYECLQVNSENIEEDIARTIASPLIWEEESGFPVCEGESVFVNRRIENLMDVKNVASDLCVDKTDNDEDIVVACIPLALVESLSKRVSIRKCCPMFTMMVEGEFCNETSQRFYTNFTDHYGFPLNITPGRIDIISPSCEGNREILLPPEYPEVRLIKGGSLIANSTEKSNILERDEFCIDRIFYQDEDFNLDDVHFFYCIKEEIITKYVLSAVGLFVSVFFLTLTLLMYTCEKKKQNLYGKTLMCHVGITGVAFFFLALLQLLKVDRRLGEVPLICEVSNYVMIFSFLASFFWLNVMSIDIWKTFSRLRSRDLISQAGKNRRFILYCSYAWGTPAIITGIAFYLSDHKLVTINNEVLCFLERSSYEYHYYFIAPITVIIICNAILYFITVWRCHQVKREIHQMHNSDKSRNDRFFKKKDQLVLNVKLFVCMGITWGMEVFSFFLRNHTYTATILFLTDAINALYGLIIFLIFVMKEKKIRSMSRRMSQWVDRRRFGSVNVMNFRKISTSVNPTSTISTSCGDSTAVTSVLTTPNAKK